MTYLGDDVNIFVEKTLEGGYYPEFLPPVFQITNLHEASHKIIPRGEFISKTVTTEPARFNASKRGGQRRIFSVPNPVTMMDQALFFVKYQAEMNEHFARSSDTLSRPFFSKDVGRPIQISNYSAFHRKRREVFASSRYVVKTDISRFYHSIYTHSIPWALHGKSESKKDRKPDSKNIFGNRLDQIIRQGQDGQTVGIAVGPDYSRLVGEIVSVAIDASFRRLAGEDAPMLRLVDDIYIGADNLDDAHIYLSQMREAIRQFELDVNESKTVVLRASEDTEPFWPVEIRREIERFSQSSATSRARKSEFVSFLDEVFRKSSERNDDGIVRFALRRIDQHKAWNKFWDVLEPFLVRAAISFPHCWPYVAQVSAWRNKQSGVNSGLWRTVIEKAIQQNARNGHDSEVVWALWLAKELKVKISQETLESVIRQCGCLAITLALDVHKSNALEYKIAKELVLERIGDRPMLGGYWLLAYEADRQFNFKIRTKNQAGHDLFKILYDDDVSFYDPLATLPSEGEGEDSTAIVSVGENYEDDEFDDDTDEEDEDDETGF